MTSLRPRVRRTFPAPPDSSIGRIPRARVVERGAFLLDLVRGRSVIHLGFVGTDRSADKRERHIHLHGELARAAGRLVGIDTDEAGVDAANGNGYEAYVADCADAAAVRALNLEPAEIVLAGELIEHLERPGDMLDAIRPLVGQSGHLVITTPNPLALTNVLLAFARLEVQNADHVGWHSYRTLATLLDRHDYRLDQLAYYAHPRYAPPRPAPPRVHARVGAFNVYQAVARPLFRVAPSLADGIIVFAAPHR